MHTPTRSFDVVDCYLDRAQKAIEADLPSFLERVRADDAYGEYIADYPSRPGKSFRPSVGLAATEAHGGTQLDGCVTVMVALELLHNAFLIHDDLEDGSSTRRGQPSLHVRYGEAAAVHAGDSLVVLALRRLDALAPVVGWPRAAAVRSLFESALSETVEGQGLEFQTYRKPLSRLDERDYFDIVVRKTAAYTVQFPLMVGALLGSWQSGVDPAWSALAEYGLAVGVLFQFVDDIKNYNDTIPGKTADDDLQEGKLTPMLLLGWKLATPTDRSQLEEFFQAPRAQRGSAWCRSTKLIIDRLGVPEAAQKVAVSLADGATDAAGRAFNGSRRAPALEYFTSLPLWLCAQIVE